jgi:spore coat protein JB
MERMTEGGEIKMRCEQVEMLNQIQALEFVAVDFNLYLDTHPDDGRALSDYTNTIEELQRLRMAYNRYGGSLTPMDQPKQGCWKWIEEPWPWQIEY